MEIRNYTPADKGEVVAMVSNILEDMFNGDPAEFKVLKEFNTKKDYIMYIVAVIDGKIVGTGALKKLNDDKVRLKRVYVAPEYQGRGISQKILDKLLEFAKEEKYKEAHFHTYPIMQGARRFHRRNGFVETTGNDPYQIHVVKRLNS